MMLEKNTSRNWLPHEDKALIELYQQQGIRKWTKISQLLSEQFGVLGRSAKNCRERYNNHLNPEIKRQQWLPEEQTKLIQIQKEIGNCWADISRQLPGRTDNAVKNKFYSKFRKAIRNINQVTRKLGLQKLHQLKMGFIHRLVSEIDLQFKQKNDIQPKLIQNAQQLRDKILTFENINIEKDELYIETLLSLNKEIQNIKLSFTSINIKDIDSIVQSSQIEEKLFSYNNKIYFNQIGQNETKKIDQQWMKSTPHLIIISSEEKLFQEHGLNDACLEWEQYGRQIWGVQMHAESSIDT